MFKVQFFNAFGKSVLFLDFLNGKDAGKLDMQKSDI